MARRWITYKGKHFLVEDGEFLIKPLAKDIKERNERHKQAYLKK